MSHPARITMKIIVVRVPAPIQAVIKPLLGCREVRLAGAQVDHVQIPIQDIEDPDTNASAF